VVSILSAGACKGLFQHLFPKRLSAKGLASGKAQASFGAVGAMKDLLLQGQACDLLVLTLPLLEQLALEGWVLADTIRPLGQVGTGLAISSRLKSRPDVTSREALAANLRAATAIHFPDPVKATAGIHFQAVLNELGLQDEVAARCLHYANGAAAMDALAKHAEQGGSLQIGCTQVSEILYTPGVRLVGELPEPFQLRTTYAAALTPAGLESRRAAKMLAKLSASTSLSLRSKSGFLA
jgi:molybdate transport system substrate-binding protein